MIDETALSAIEKWCAEQSYRSDFIGWVSGQIEALIAELRASRKVVEKAAGVQRTAHPFPHVVSAAVVDEWWDALKAALAEYHRVINVRSEASQ